MIELTIRTNILIVFEWKMESLLVFHALLPQELTFAKIIIMRIDVKQVRLNLKMIIVIL